jgi:tRNA (mo5U34)-methyltransferase
MNNFSETNTIDPRIEEIKWRHTFDFGDGLFAKGCKNTYLDLEQWQFPQDLFAGKTVLDVGACDGFFSFFAEQNGATRVLAIDPYRWTFDDRFSGQAGFNLAKEIYGSNVETSVLPLEKICTEEIGEWDVVLYLGVFYHLRDPIDVTERVAAVTKQTLVLETHIDPVAQPIDQPLLRFYPDGEIYGDKTTYWGPNTCFLDQFLNRIGFASVESRLIYTDSRAISYANKTDKYKPDWGQW